MDSEKTEAQKDLFSADYKPDPVAVAAAKYATEVTEPPKPRHPMANKVLTVLAVIILLLGMASVILGTINSVENAHQADELKLQQQCNTQLLKAISEEQTARAKIAADDRNNIEQLVRSIAQAKTSGQVQHALSTFQHRSHTNNVRRAKIASPDINSIDVCKSTLKKGILPSGGARVSTSSGPKSHHPGRRPTTSVSSSANSAGQPSVVHTTPANGPVRTVPVQNPPTHTATATHIVKVPQPRPTKTVTKTQPAPKPRPHPSSSSIVPILPLPTICVGGLVCVEGP